MQNLRNLLYCLKLLIVSSITVVGGGISYASSDRHCFTLNYPINVSEVRPDFSSNRETADSISAILKLIDEDPALKLNRIDISGASSPEGNPRINALLADKRMRAAGKYLTTYLNVSDSVINYTGSFVPWDELLESIDRRYSSKATEIRKILTEGNDTSLADVTRRINRLRSLDGGKIWSDMKRNVLPGLRRAAVICITTEDVPLPESQPVIAPQPVPEPEPEVVVFEPAAEVVEAVEEVEPTACQRAWHISTDALGWAAAVSNITGEFDFACNWSVALNLRYSAWNYGKTTRKYRTFEFRPQVRYWFAEGHNRWFVEAHLSMISYNVALPGWDYRIQDTRGKHPALGGGIGGGYRLPFRNPHWAAEFTLGAGIYHLDYERFDNRGNGPKVDRKKRNFFGVDHVGISIVYNFNPIK